MNRVNGKLIVIAAPSGAGKTSLVKALLESNDDMGVAVSHTTRAMRPGETDGVDYHFVSKEAFQSLLAEGGFIEHAEVFGNWYGTSLGAMDTVLNQGKHLVLEIDYQGAAQVRDKVPHALSIFILPPSLKALKDRLTNRAQDDAESIERRSQEAFNEISHYHQFDYLIVNDNFDLALSQMDAVIKKGAPEFAVEAQREILASLISELLSSSP
jgi:guanylate kinase